MEPGPFLKKAPDPFFLINSHGILTIANGFDLRLPTGMLGLMAIVALIRISAMGWSFGALLWPLTAWVVIAPNE